MKDFGPADMFESVFDRISGCVAALASMEGEKKSDLELKELERRVCFSAVPLVGELLSAADTVDMEFNVAMPQESPAATAIADSTEINPIEPGESSLQSQQESLELIFIDSGVPDADQLMDEFTALGVDASQIFILSPDADGIEQVTDILAGFEDVGAVHIVSHGSAGSFQLGETNINAGNISDYSDNLNQWEQSLTDEADILLYGCNLASNESGMEVLRQISVATGADVAGSDDVTGDESLGGDWTLEAATGVIEAMGPFMDTASVEWLHTLNADVGTALLFSTDADISTTGSNFDGVNNWDSDDAVSISGSNLSFEPSGGTDGSYSIFADGLADGNKLRGLHIVGSDIVVNGTLNLLEGDALFITENTDLPGLSGVDNQDVVGFRPDTVGDYSSGTYFMVLENKLSAELRGVTLAESDTVVGGTLVERGDFLLSRNGGSTDDNIWLYTNDGVTESFSSLVELDGGDFNFHRQIHGLELIERQTVIGGTTLEAGQILMAWNTSITLPNGDDVAAHDIMVLDLTTAGDNATGTAFKLFDGSVADLANDERIRSVALISDSNQAPTDLTSGIELNTDGNDAYLLDTSGYHFITGSSQVTMEFRFSGLSTPADSTTLYSVAKGTSGDYLSIHADGTLDWNGFTSTGTYSNLFDGGIHSVAFAIDLTGGGLSFFVDGALVESIATPIYPGPATGDATFILGQYQGTELDNFDADRAFSGTLHDVRIWDDIRTSAEVAENFDHKVDASDIPDNLIVNWQMHQLGGGGNSVVDIVDPDAGITLEVRNVGVSAGYTPNTPTDGLRIDENSFNGTSVGFVVPTDLDANTGGYTFSFAGGAGAAGGRFAIDSTTGEITVANASLLNSEANSNHSLTVKVVDDSGGEYSESLTITVVDINEIPQATSTTAFEVTRGSSGNQWITDYLSVSDPDSTDTSDQLTYRITSEFSNGTLRRNGIELFTGDEFSVADVESGLLTYDHDGSPSATDSVGLSVRDGGEDGVGPLGMTLSVQVLNAAPTANPETYDLNEGDTLKTYSSWFDANWTQRRVITFDNSAAGTLVDYPVLVRLDAATFDYANTLDAGEDLRFVDSNGTLLNYEIENWDESGVSNVWVQVPQIDGGSSSNYVEMYYGNDAASAGSTNAATWGAGFDVVQHLNQNTLDSTANGVDSVAVTTDSATGLIGGAQSFSAADDVVNLGNDASVNDVFAGGGTVSAWINADSWGANDLGRILDKASGTTPAPDGWSVATEGSGRLTFEYGFAGGHSRWRSDAGALDLSTWHHVAVSFDSSSTANDPVFYIDGVAVNVTQTSFGLGANVSDAAQELAIGNHLAGLNRAFDGVIDEVRVENGMRSADEIAADVRSVQGGFASVGNSEAFTAMGVIDNDSDPEGDSLTVTLVSGPSNAASFTLNPDGSFEYEPNVGFVGVDSFDYQISDGNGGFSTATATLEVGNVNFAPNLDDTGAFGLTNVIAGNTNPLGDSVDALIASAGGDAITDGDGDSEGIVVTSVDDTHGTWEFSLDGTSWHSFSAAAGGNSAVNVLLEGSDRIRFIPSAGFDGNAGDITFRGWDQTAGAAGDANVDLTITGGYSAFSDQVATVSLDVVPAAGFSISVPVAQDTGFDSPITFRVADSNVVTFDDGVVGNSYVRLELSTSNGLLNVLHTSGLTFAEGTANDASRIVLYGSESRLNQALEDLTFTPNSGFYGTADISVVAEVNASVRGDYGFEDGTANDSSHFANHGTIDAGVASVDGERGNVARFDGTQSVSIPTNFNQGESLSLTTWVKFESGGDQELVSIGEGLRLTQLPEADGGLSVLFMRPAAYDGSVYQQVASNIVLPEGEWHHIAFTFDDGEQRLYVDGVAVATSSLLGSIEYSTSDTIFGADPNDAGRGFVGMLDDVQVHGSVLSAEEVASLSIDAGTVSGTLQVNVAAPPPTAVGDLADVDEGESVTIALTSNDVQTFAAIDGSSIAITSGPSHGTLIIATDGSVEYVHDGSETLADSFSYTIKDIDDRVSNVAIVDLTVTAINDVPDAHDDSFSLVEGQTHLQSVSVFNNDIDDDGPSAIGTVVDGPTSGTLNWNTDGTFEYIHDGSETTTDEFTYTIDDGNGGVGQATVLIDIVPENDAPVANDDEKVATAMSPLTISAAELLANDTDSEFDSTSILVLNQPLNGSVTVDGAGDIVYLAASGFSGVDTFTYVITDGVDVSDPATVTVTVELPPPPPSALITDSESSAESSGEDLSDDDSSSGVGGTDLTGAGGLGDEEDDVIAPPPRAESGNADVVVISRSDSDFSVDVNGSELLSNLGLVVRRLTDAAPDSPTIVIDFVAQLLQSDVPLSQSLVGYELTRAADTLGEELDSELIHDQIVVGAIVATSATLSLGGLYWALRFGYLAAGLIGSVPAWKALDPSTLAAILENDGDETIEDVLAGV